MKKMMIKLKMKITKTIIMRKEKQALLIQIKEAIIMRMIVNIKKKLLKKTNKRKKRKILLSLIY